MLRNDAVDIDKCADRVHVTARGYGGALRGTAGVVLHHELLVNTLEFVGGSKLGNAIRHAPPDILTRPGGLQDVHILCARLYVERGHFITTRGEA